MPDENVGEENTPQQNTITDVTGDSTHAGTSGADIFVFTADNGTTPSPASPTAWTTST